MKFLAKLLAQTVGVGLGVFCAILVSKSIEVKDIKENTLISYIADAARQESSSPQKR
ncbi:TIGR02281 family clan AA aspartic protease [Methylovulum psychrotolerans]|uniref:TIGR02281 family clan AA aspartic protease n=1 Tax=Methylovulum psychrotolerans TaxID=1704499 RepID=A0A2S5CR84_9GAMM|nr:TIGR02281 family clan AA aspartic protease [Methylovulum psychrotolerans]